MKFIHFTDLHLVAPGAKLWGLDPSANLRACLDDIAKHHPDAEFCAITGDLTERGDTEVYSFLSQTLAAFALPTHVILGNHDDRDNFKTANPDHPVDHAGFVQHAIEKDGRVFLFLDTLKGPPSSAGLYDAPRREWLKSELEKAAGKPVYLFMHHPPFAIAHPLMDLIMLDDPEDFAALLKGHDVRHIFFGHGHRAVSGTWRGISFSALPSLNHQLPLVGGSVQTVYSVEPLAYSVVHITDDGIIIHNDAFLDRQPAAMAADAERGNWY
ncbi:phosphodiesterase [Rhizobium sp. KVB221]|uniref:Phosphodiesterase n=1 Tax=Rhizobium setariae TaxID=2801340 RepID=A0A936YKU3_9HYPH|nr:phosphodiesterase [Rhizobium setariae]MBL0372190.1 phosphodiesterase [Rhizobium setariae]